MKKISPMITLQPDFRLKHLYHIRNKDGIMVPFRPNKMQIDYHKNRHTRNIILKSRQLGFSTYKCIDGLNHILTHPGHKALMIAHTEDAAKGLFEEKIQNAWLSLPAFERDDFDVLKNSKDELAVRLALGNTMKYKSSIAVQTGARSGTYQYIHITELSYLDKTNPNRALEVFTGALPAISIDGQFDIESTARGSYGIFYDTFMQAYKRKTPKSRKDFKAHFYNWQWDEYELSRLLDSEIDNAIAELPVFMKEYQKEYTLTDREIAFYYLQYIAFGEDITRMRQEYPTTVEEAFMASEEMFFSKECSTGHTIKEPIIHNKWRIYEPYDINSTYVLGVDVSEGIGRDSSTAVLLDATNNRVVAVFDDNRTPPDTLSTVLLDMARQYNYPLLAIERNNHGHATISHIKLQYPLHKIYQETKLDTISNEKTMRYGWTTTAQSKPKMFYDLATNLRSTLEKRVSIPDIALIDEIKLFPRSFIIENLGQQTRHFDLLTAFAIAYQVALLYPKYPYSSRMDDYFRGV